jgi:hypothetical protein
MRWEDEKLINIVSRKCDHGCGLFSVEVSKEFIQP